MNNFFTFLGTVVAACGAIVFVCFLVAFPEMLLWNWLMPAIFGLPKITFWQALGLNLLAEFLIKSNSSNINSKK